MNQAQLVKSLMKEQVTFNGNDVTSCILGNQRGRYFTFVFVQSCEINLIGSYAGIRKN